MNQGEVGESVPGEPTALPLCIAVEPNLDIPKNIAVVMGTAVARVACATQESHLGRDMVMILVLRKETTLYVLIH